MAEPVRINLWELLTAAADRKEGSERPCSAFEKADDIVKACSPSKGFGTELSLTVTEHGSWIVEIFNHDGEDDSSVKMKVAKYGTVEVTRVKSLDDVHDTRTVKF